MAGSRLFWIGFAVLLIVAVAFRIVGLDHLPGVNGDEAYYGAIVMALRAGDKPGMVSGSGLPLNPFYIDLLYLIHAAFPAPSFWLLRLPALLSGLAVLALAYPVVARVRDRPTAIATTLLLACCPTAIAYSRFGWDQSQAPLAALLCLYFALERRGMSLLIQIIGGAVMFGAALVIHPINVFLLPILLGPAAVELGHHIAAVSQEQRRRLLWWMFLGFLVLVVLSVLAMALLVPANIVQMYASNLLPDFGRRLIDFRGWAVFANRYADLLTGATVYRYITGPLGDRAALLHGVLFWALAIPMTVLGVFRLYRQRDRIALGLLGGLAVSLASFYLFVGTELIGPSLERYSMWLITPSWLALAILWRSFLPVVDKDNMDESPAESQTAGVSPTDTHISAVGTALRGVLSGPVVPSPGGISRNATECGPSGASALSNSRLGSSLVGALAGLLGVCAFMLAGFATHYFGVLLETGGQAHRTFRTAAVEPKQAAFEFIRSTAAGTPTGIYAEDWWTYFPLYYLAGNQRQMGVAWCRAALVDVANMPPPLRLFVVGFAGGPCDVWLTKNAPNLPRRTFNDYRGQAVLHVWDLGTDRTLLGDLADVTAVVPD